MKHCTPGKKASLTWLQHNGIGKCLLLVSYMYAKVCRPNCGIAELLVARTCRCYVMVISVCCPVSSPMSRYSPETRRVEGEYRLMGEDTRAAYRNNHDMIYVSYDLIGRNWRIRTLSHGHIRKCWNLIGWNWRIRTLPRAHTEMLKSDWMKLEDPYAPKGTYRNAEISLDETGGSVLYIAWSANTVVANRRTDTCICPSDIVCGGKFCLYQGKIHSDHRIQCKTSCV